MPDSVVVGSSFPVHDREVNWPFPSQQAGQSPPAGFNAPDHWSFDTQPFRYSNTQVIGFGSSNQVAGAGHHGIFSPAIQPGSLWAQTRCGPGDSRAYGFEGIFCPMTMEAASLAAGVTLPSFERVYSLKLYLFTEDAATAATTRLLLVPFINSGGSIPNRPSNLVGVNNTGGFGIAGNGAGQWQYVSYDRSGVNLLREAVALPVHNQAQINCFEAIRINARSGADASWIFRWNGEDFLTRDYTAALLEPPIAGEWGYTPMVEATSAIQQTPNYRINCKYGRFLPTGVEVTG